MNFYETLTTLIKLLKIHIFIISDKILKNFETSISFGLFEGSDLPYVVFVLS